VSGATAGLPAPGPGSTSSDLLPILVAGLAATALLAVVARQRMLRTHLAAVPKAPEQTLAAYRGAPLADDIVAAAGLRGAITALRRADDRGDPAGAAGLGVLLEQQGDIHGALDAYRRADQRGNIHGTLKLGEMLAQQGDRQGAIDAYRRADERGNALGALNLGRMLAEQGDRQGAIDAFRRARERGDAHVSRAARAAWLKAIGSE
jgi:tetratricopeptide (TPR) repeat protein